MNYEKELLRSGIELLVFKGEDNPDWEKYVLLEKLLQSLADSDKYNVGMFNEADTKRLIGFYKETDSKFISNLRSRFIAYFEEDGYTFDESNFYKMIRGSRKPNIHLLNAFVDILLRGYLVDSNGQYSMVNPLETFLDNSPISSAYSYIRFCIAVSTIRKEKFQAYEISGGNATIKSLTTNDLSLITFILNRKIYLSKYIHCDFISKDDIDAQDDYYEAVLAELYAPMPWELPMHSLSSFEVFNHLISEVKNLTEVHPFMCDELIVWLNMYLNEYYGSHDLYFHQILFLLSFASENALDGYVDFIPSHNLSISSSDIVGYYADIKHILEFPLITDNSPIENSNLRKLHHDELNKTCMSLSLPNWLLFTLCHLTNKQMLTAKYLYITLVLRKRYHRQKDNDSFPSGVLELLRKEIPNIDSLYDICSKH